MQNLLKILKNQNLKETEIIFLINNEKDNVFSCLSSFSNLVSNVKLISLFENENIMNQIKGEYIFILDSNNYYLNSDFNYFFNISKESNLDVLLFNPDYDFKNDNFNHFLSHNDEYNLFKLFKYNLGIFKKSYLLSNSIDLYFNGGEFDYLTFYFKSLFSTSKKMIINKQIFNKRYYISNNLEDYFKTNCSNIFNLDDIINLDIDNLFKNINNIFDFFQKNHLYSSYKNGLLNYLFGLLRNIFNLNIQNKKIFFIQLKNWISSLNLKYNVDLLLYLEPSNLKLFNFVSQSNSLSELILRYDYDQLHYENIKLHYENLKNNVFMTKFSVGRMDIINSGSADNSIEIKDVSDKNCRITYPQWLKNNNGSGAVIESFQGVNDFKIKCIKDGLLKIILKGIDFRDVNHTRIPIYIDFIKLVIDDEIIINKNMLVSHDNPYIFNKKVKNGDEISVHAEWLPINDCTDFENISTNDILKSSTQFFVGRIDIKNKGTKENNLKFNSISDNLATVTHPSWYKDNYGVGTIIHSLKGVIDFNLSCINKGTFELLLRSMDFRDIENNRIPILIDFTLLKINDEIIFDKNKLVSHDYPFKYTMDVQNNENIKVHAEWMPLNNNSSYREMSKKLLNYEEISLLKKENKVYEEQITNLNKKIKKLNTNQKQLIDEKHELEKKLVKTNEKYNHYKEEYETIINSTSKKFSDFFRK